MVEGRLKNKEFVCFFEFVSQGELNGKTGVFPGEI
jgi:hypothetical protein